MCNAGEKKRITFPFFFFFLLSPLLPFLNSSFWPFPLGERNGREIKGIYLCALNEFMKFFSFVEVIRRTGPLVALFERRVIDSAHTYVWLFSASNSSAFPLSDDHSGGYEGKKNNKKKNRISLQRPGRFWLICWERKRNYTGVSHQMLDGTASKQKRRAECRRASWRKHLWTKWWDALTCTYAHSSLNTQITLWSKHGGSCC